MPANQPTVTFTARDAKAVRWTHSCIGAKSVTIVTPCNAIAGIEQRPERRSYPDQQCGRRHATEMRRQLLSRFARRGYSGRALPKRRRGGVRFALRRYRLEVEVNPKLRAQVGMPIRDHVDPLDRRNLLDILQASSDSIDGHMMMFSLAHGAYSVAWRAP